MVATVSWEGSAGAAAIAPRGRASPSITRKGVVLFLFCISLPFLNHISLILTTVFVSHFFFSPLMTRCRTHNVIPCRLKPDPEAPCRSSHAFYSPTVFLCFSQLYFFAFLNCISQIMSVVYLQTVGRPGSTSPILAALYWRWPAPPRMLLLWPPAPWAPEMQSRCGQQAFPIYPMTSNIQREISLSK